MPETIILRDAEVRELIAAGTVTVRRKRRANTPSLDGRFVLVQPSPFGRIGQRLAVREAYAIEHTVDGEPPSGVLLDGRPVHWGDEGDGDQRGPYDWHWQAAHYRATDPPPDLCCESEHCRSCGDGGPGYGPHWRSAATMPKWASRITVEVVALRVEPDPWEWVAELEVRK